MKRTLRNTLLNFIFSAFLMLISAQSYASHIVAAELRYKWVSGLTYEITVYLYGDCGPASSGSFSTLPTSTPQVCVYDGPTLQTGAGFPVNCPIQVPTVGAEVTPVCPDSLGFTQCTSTSYTLPGIKKFVYKGTVTLPRTSANWRFVYGGFNGGGAASGRAAAITNLFSPGSTIMQLIDTLNNSVTNTRGNNSSPVLTVEPVPFFCYPGLNCFNPGAVDLFDVSPSQPAGDSLVFSLIAATNNTGGGGCPAPGGPISYISTFCPPTTPASGQFPLSVVDCTPASWSFDQLTGQLCFSPIGAQRSTVVYNVREFRDDTISMSPMVVNHVLVGTLQREMTFLVRPCTLTYPTSKIDSFTGPGDTTAGGHHFFSCANSGTFVNYINPTSADPTLLLTVTATGLSAGFVFSVTGNGTTSPHATLTGNTALIIPGNYTIYVTTTDNHCPLTGSKTIAYTFDILPVPTISEATVVSATCSDKALVKITPGGTGKPWTIKLSHNPALLFPLVDTFRTFLFDTSAVFDSLSPGRYYATIFTAISNNCHVADSFFVDTPHFTITTSHVDPSYCGANDGHVVINGLNPGHLDTVRYNFQGSPQPPQGFFSTAFGTDTVFNLLAGTYDNIIVQEGYCFTNPAGPETLINPPFIWRTVTTKDATKCGFCDGVDTLFGLHPGQLDTIKYDFVPKGGVVSSPYTLSHFITADSMVAITGLCAGTYRNFIVNTGGVCNYLVPGPFVIDAPGILPDFDYVIHYGCKADTVFFTNLSLPAADLTYRWDFGDGVIETSTNPKHVYYNTNNTYTVKLYITNTKCVDSMIKTVTLNNVVSSGFTFSPDPYVCQLSPVTYTSTATGTNLTYLWDFGDGNSDIVPNPSHTYTNTGQYTIKLIVANHVIPTPTFFSPCYDTAYDVVSVDSISALSILATDSVICRGQAITFKGVYSKLGDTLTTWTFGDGIGTVNMDPIIHSYDGENLFTVTLNVKYRSCPEKTTQRDIRVFGLPSVYLGQDTSICPGGIPIRVRDDRNAGNNAARWKWNTGETTSSITVVKPGSYSAVVTIDGCSSSDTIEVKRDCYMEVPNVFTPNGDGTNDYFFPRQLLARGLTSFKMDVYNRWGQTIYSSNSIDGRGWDGNFNDKPQPEGVYIYLIEAKFKDGQMENHQGNVTLLR